jgi:DNA invertase Pin-like site-specific DNA recombinase
VSGALPVAARPGLTAALDMIRTGEADALLLPKLDRLALTLSVQETALASVWAQGGRVFLPEGEVSRDDPDDPMRTAMRQMMGVFSQLERGMITARLRAGRAAKAAAGGTPTGHPRSAGGRTRQRRTGWLRSRRSRPSSDACSPGGRKACPYGTWCGG